jgi:hypothetical protein
MAVSGVATLQGRWLAAVFFPLGHPTLYAYGRVLDEVARLLIVCSIFLILRSIF